MVARRSRRSWLPLVAGIVVGALVPAVAGAQSPSAAPSAAPLGPIGSPPAACHPEGAPEDATITLGVLPLADVAPVHLAIATGLFADQGLTVEPQIVQGGAAAIPGLVAGDLDITFGNDVSALLASSQGIDLKFIADQNHAQPGFSSIMTLPDSGIATAADLVGHKLAVNTLANVAEITSRAQVKDAGADPDAVEYIEIPFPDMIAALEQGNVDAIFAVEPFATLAAQQLGAVEVANPYGGRLENFPVASFQATGGYAQANPNTITAFQCAMISASQLAATDPQSVVSILPTYTSLTPELAAVIHQPLYVSELDPAALQPVVDLMVEFGLLASAPDLSALIVPTPAGEAAPSEAASPAA